MRTATPRLMRMVMAIVMVTGAVSVWQVMPRRDAPLVDGAAWVARHGRGAVSLATLNRYPARYQDAIYGSLAPAQKLSIWRDFLAGASGAGRLTPLKRDVLARVATALRAEDFAPGVERRPALRRLIEEAEVILGAQFSLLKSGAWRKVTFASEITAGNLGGTLRLLPLHVAERLLGPAVVSAAADCNCWVDEEGKYDCAAREGFYKYCAPSVGGRVCNPIGSYNGPCGLFDDRPCDGICAYVATGGGGGSGGGGGGGGCCGYSEGNYCDASCQCCEAV